MKATSRTFLIVLAMATILATVATGGALAAKGGNGHASRTGSGTLTLVMVNDANADGQPSYGDTVTFNVSTTTTEPHVSLQCYQGGVLVYGAASGFYADYPWPWTQFMTLSSSSWTGGPADCTATLYYFSGTKVVTLATLDFPATA
jgi:hypothetical protein